MPLLSRFKKGKASSDDEALADVEEDEGLLIATGDQQDGSEAQPDQEEAPEAALAESPAAGEENAPDEQADAEEAAAEEAAAEEAAAEEADVSKEVAEDSSPDAADAQAETDEGEGAAEDDLLSAFREADTVTEYGDLTKDIEDIPITQLLEDARELRSMLPNVEGEGEASGG